MGENLVWFRRNLARLLRGARNDFPLQMSKLSGKYVGVDVGGTKIAAGLVEAGTWRVLKTVELPTDAFGGRAVVLDNVIEAIKAVSADKIKGIGVGFAGAVDFKRGRIIRGPNFAADLAGFAMAKELSNRLKTPVTLDNDVRCFTLAEAKIGVAKGHANVFGMTLGTGIGGELVINSQPYRGKNNCAGEIGHATFAMGSEMLCGCGQTGHFEAMASGTAIRRLAGAVLGEELSATEVIAAAAQGNPKAKAVIEAYRESLAAGLANIAYIYDPDIVVLGGGLATIEDLWRPAVTIARQRVIYAPLKDLVVRRSRLGNRANIVGAAMLAAR